MYNPDILCIIQHLNAFLSESSPSLLGSKTPLIILGPILHLFMNIQQCRIMKYSLSDETHMKHLYKKVLNKELLLGNLGQTVKLKGCTHPHLEFMSKIVIIL